MLQRPAYPPTPATTTRPVSEFDSGINTSTAWTERNLTGTLHARQHYSESDARQPMSEDEDDEPEIMTRPARALYAFDGKAEFRELRVEAGDELDVVKEDVGHGWSLVRDVTGEIGLLPQTYYTLTVEFSLSPNLQLDVARRREASGSSITPRPSPRNSKVHSQLSALVPQNTGEWLPTFPSFRQSLLGGKSLNRFSSFVTSGAESFLLNGSSLPKTIIPHVKDASSASMLDEVEEQRMKLNSLGLGEADRHIIDAGEAGPRWHSKTPSFSVLVHSPTKMTDGLTGAYTLYSITSLFAASPSLAATADWIEVADPDDAHPPSPTETTPTGDSAARVTVHRRFSHFVMLHTALSRRLPGIVLPPLPEKQYAGRFSEDFVEARRGDLERYLNKIVRHPVVRYAEVLTFFLGCDNDAEWTRLLPQHMSAPATGPSFYARIYHPAFNVDLEEAEQSIKAFRRHARAVGKGVQGLRSVFGRVREARIEMSKAERALSYSLLSLITSTPIASAPVPAGTTSDDEGDLPSARHIEETDDKKKGLINTDGAWCWREGCTECLKVTKAVQKTSETLQTVANLYDGHARRTQLATHESLKLMAHPSSIYESTITTHKSTVSRYREAVLGSGSSAGPTYSDEDMVARCETVLNVTMAEMDVYHKQKSEDLKSVAVDHLDGEIAFYEQILSRLKAARSTYDGAPYAALASSPRLPSIYEKDLAYDPSSPQSGATNPHLSPKPIPQPCPHVFDSAPMRPVSAAIQEGVGMFLGDGTGRGSMFGRFW